MPETCSEQKSARLVCKQTDQSTNWPVGKREEYDKKATRDAIKQWHESFRELTREVTKSLVSQLVKELTK